MADEKSKYPDYDELIRRLVAVESAHGVRWNPTELELRLQVLNLVVSAGGGKAITEHEMTAAGDILLAWLRKETA